MLGPSVSYRDEGETSFGELELSEAAMTKQTEPVQCIWTVNDSDNCECGGIVSLHYSAEGAIEYAKQLVKRENEALASRKTHDEDYPKEMTYRGNNEWYWTHRTISVEEAKVKP